MSIEFKSAIDAAHRNLIHKRYLTRGGDNLDREIAHERALKFAEKMQGSDRAMAIMHRLFVYDDPILRTESGGIQSPNPLAIEAGFDKNARMVRFLGEGQGFGIVKVGSITKIPYEGNKRPRVFDLPQSQGIINRMGFPGEGVDNAAARLEDLPIDNGYSLIVNIAASKPSFDAGTQTEDYMDVAKKLLNYGQGHEINVSSPNTEGVRSLQDTEVFVDFASGLETVYAPRGNLLLPIYYKFGDQTPEQLVKNMTTAKDKGARGITLGNTTVDPLVRNSLILGDKHRNETGGISGRPLKRKALEVSHRAYHDMGGDINIHFAGGIQTAEDLWNALTYGGASSAGVYTSYVRIETSSPYFTVNILKPFAAAMRAHGMKSMADFADIRGKDVPFPKI